MNQNIDWWINWVMNENKHFTALSEAKLKRFFGWITSPKCINNLKINNFESSILWAVNNKLNLVFLLISGFDLLMTFNTVSRISKFHVMEKVIRYLNEKGIFCFGTNLWLWACKWWIFLKASPNSVINITAKNSNLSDLSCDHILCYGP